MLNSIALTTIKSKSAGESIFDDEAPIAAPLNPDAATEEATPQADTPAETN